MSLLQREVEGERENKRLKKCIIYLFEIDREGFLILLQGGGGGGGNGLDLLQIEVEV